MSQKKNPMKNLKVTKDFRNDNAGIVYTIMPPDVTKDIDNDSLLDDGKFGVIPDPVIPHNREARRKPPKTPPEKPKVEGTGINPSLSTRVAFHKHYHPEIKPDEIVKYVVPETKWKKRKKAEIRERQKELYVKCEYSVLRVPSPVNLMNLSQLEMESPELSKVKVMPSRPSVQSGYLYPEPPTDKELDLHKPKSGIFINVKPDEKDSDADLLTADGIKREKKPKPQKQTEEVEEESIFEWEDYYEDYFYEEGESPFHLDKSTAMELDLPLRMKRQVVEQSSKATSLDEKDFVFEETSWQKIPLISQLVQTFRAQDEEKKRKKRKFKKGTLESHSYTKLKQKTLCELCAKCIQGSIHQGDENFSKYSRNKQGICIPIVAMCYAKIKCLKNPQDWTEKSIDEIIEIGDNLYVDSITNNHLHKEGKLLPNDLQKICLIDDVKIKFTIDEPDINGHIRSTDKRIYNITKGLTIFFNRHKRCLLQTETLDLAIWKKRKYFYIFDGNPRRKDCFSDPNGKACLIILENLKGVITILLDRTNLENSPFLLFKINIKVLKKNEDEIECIKGTYNILNDKKAVVNGSFNLGDKCFCFSRNKQALPMGISCLVYARISQPSSWKSKTIDKIMVIGNQLYLECAESEETEELTLENIPALFTIGPYITEIFIYSNYMVDNLYKKNQCSLKRALETFFDKNTSALIQIGNYIIALWFQRNMYYYFDPYSRNTEGFKCRNGTACVSMNSDIDTLLETLTSNFDDKDAIYFIHALKVIKINRDPMNKIFPKTMSMKEAPLELLKNIKCRKSKKKAIEKPIKVDFTEYAMKKLLAGDEPNPSITEITSNIGSLNEYLPFIEKSPKKEVIITQVQERNIADLTSPSLSETQFVLERPQTMRLDELLTLMDLDALEMTQEELEQIVVEEEEEEMFEGDEYKVNDEYFEEEEDFYLVKSKYTSVHSSSLESMHLRKEEVINTDVSYCYNILPAQELPIKSKKDPERRLIIDEEIQNLELKKESKFKNVNDYQIILGEKNISELGNLDLTPPFICIMAIAYSNELPLYKWNKKTIDFILKEGVKLFNSYQISFDKIEDYHLEFSKFKMDISLESLLDTYVGSKIFEFEKPLKCLLENYLFTKSICGIIIIKNYTCVIFFKRHLLYLFEVFGCDEEGNLINGGLTGGGCLMRFFNFDSLIKRILINFKNLSSDDENEYSRIILLKPNVNKIGEDKLEKVIIQKYYNEEGKLIEPEITQSKELSKCSNFVDLPDGSQIIRGTLNLSNYSGEIDLLSPYVAIMASAVAGKYSVSTWSKDIVNYVVKCGYELHQKSKYQFLEVAKLEIPQISLGKTDFHLEVNYQFDAPFKQQILEVSLEKILHQNGDWAIIVAQEYSCSCYYKNGLFYLYDCYPSNEVGLSEGVFSNGTVSFSRFMDLHSMCKRIIYNKRKRELPEKVTYSRFVLSTCKVRYIQPEFTKPKLRKPKRKEKVDIGEEDEINEFIEEEEEEEKVQNKIGFQNKHNLYVIEGTKSLQDRERSSNYLKPDHFVAFCVCLTIINTPIKKWDTRKVNKVINQGNHIYSHAENLEYSLKRTIKNILIGRYFFDIIVKPIDVDRFSRPLRIENLLKNLFEKRKFAILQFCNCCLVIYKEDETFYLFDSYPYTFKSYIKSSDESNNETNKPNKSNNERNKSNKSNNESNESNKSKLITIQAGWTMYTNKTNLLKRIKSSTPKDSQTTFIFYSFEVISVRKAPKKVLMSHKVMQYKLDKPKPNESIGKPFHEQENWLNIHKTPWSRIQEQTACGKLRKSRDSKWNNYDIEYPNDLYSLVGSLHMTSKKFNISNRGKQTLCNLIVAIAMTNIYELSEWSERILDSVLYNGDTYFMECTKDITQTNYELSMEDLQEDCSIFPYNFKVNYSPSIEGTMFLTHKKKFNLYKALRYFFENYESRCGVIVAVKGENKRWCGFGKTHENEYFMYDCQALGPPMFYEKDGASYILRCTTLARLLHCLVLTLKGGDFFIYDVETYDFESIEPKQDEKKKDNNERDEKKRDNNKGDEKKNDQVNNEGLDDNEDEDN